jgi:hypothetical protein
MNIDQDNIGPRWKCQPLLHLACSHGHVNGGGSAQRNPV